MKPTTRKYSLYTKLKDARIFDEDSTSQEEFDRVSANGSKEISGSTSTVISPVKIKSEIFDEDANFPNSCNNAQVKQEVAEMFKSPMKMEIDENTTSSVDSNFRRKVRALRRNLGNGSDSQSHDGFSPVKQEVKYENDVHTTFSQGSLRSGFVRSPFTKHSPYVNESPMKTDSPLKRRFEQISENPSTKRNLTDESYYSKRMRKYSKAPVEIDPDILRRRQKQIDYGKNTIGYDNYSRNVAKTNRTERDPWTPDKFSKYSRRGWDGLIKQWRMALHKYDPAE